MKKIPDFLYQKASIKSILITAALLAAVAGTNFIIYFLKFLPLTGGRAYMELNIGYLPTDLFAFAESYGAAGRRLYDHRAGELSFQDHGSGCAGQDFHGTQICTHDCTYGIDCIHACKVQKGFKTLKF